ncbi:hypothetical protein DSO57_1013639 [Entomophthora muscae]|uniref:Uncharacterized protein n=1 Tax=Entomophthora muscae TaxID=34485 RepID=A0ACC2T5Q7_9FUNG|nr:hypothetical protein DSO57_1013639 [Entomophthora muscae]
MAFQKDNSLMRGVLVQLFKQISSLEADLCQGSLQIINSDTPIQIADLEAQLCRLQEQGCNCRTNGSKLATITFSSKTIKGYENTEGSSKSEEIKDNHTCNLWGILDVFAVLPTREPYTPHTTLIACSAYTTDRQSITTPCQKIKLVVTNE